MLVSVMMQSIGPGCRDAEAAVDVPDTNSCCVNLLKLWNMAGVCKLGGLQAPACKEVE
jgi:hypothetical protein